MASELDSLFKKAEQLYDENKFQEVISLLSDEVLTKHTDARLYNYRGMSWDDVREYDKAIADYTKAIELKPDYANAYYNRGISWHNKGEYDKAIADYNKAIELNPNYASLYNNRGNSWYSKDEYDKAIADYTKALELRSNDADTYMNRGSAWDANGEYDKAIADCNKALELNHDSVAAYYTRGNTWNNKGEYDKAIADYNKAIELNPDYANPYYGRGYLFKNKGDHAKSKADFIKFLKLSPDKESVWVKTAKSHIAELTKLLNDKNLTEIAAVINDIKKLLLFNSGCITHYTGMSVAKLLLLQDSRFRISEGAFLNDTSEGRELTKFLAIQFTPEKNADDTVAEPFARKPFIGSFVEETKHDDLNLWRMYGKENKEEAKGCALTIKADKLIEGINKELTDKSGKKPADSPTAARVSDDINFYRVAYRSSDDPNNFAVPELKKADNNKLNKLMAMLKEKVTDYKKEMNDETKKDLEEYINSIAFLFKSDVYRSENELRLVVKGVGFPKEIDSVNFNPPRAYINLVNIRPMLEKITLGPKVERPDEWAAAFYYSYDKEDEEKKPMILISHLPFK